MEIEKSAGAIIFRKNKEIKYLLLHYKYKTEYYEFPRGNIEANESEVETAFREVKEETGIKELKLIEGFKESIEFFYRREGKIVKKNIVFFLMETKEKDVKISEEHIGYRWCNFSEAMKLLKFENSKKVLEKANNFINSSLIRFS